VGGDEEELAGGVANKGAVVRVGETVRRPTGPYTETSSQVLRHLEAVGFDGTPRFLGIDEQGREVLSYVPGDVPLPSFPAWSMTDDVLAEVAVLMRGFHDATRSFDRAQVETWPDELTDPDGGDVICHNDVCPENVVFGDAHPTTLLDFDFAAPGRRVWDVAMAASMWAPLADPAMRFTHPPGLDAVHRAAVFVRSYGMEHFTAEEFVAAVDEAKRVGARFVRRHVDAGEVGFVEMVSTYGGEERYRRNKEWWAANRSALLDRLGVDETQQDLDGAR
jgi:hypothetical protein